MRSPEARAVVFAAPLAASRTCASWECDHMSERNDNGRANVGMDSRVSCAESDQPEPMAGVNERFAARTSDVDAVLARSCEQHQNLRVRTAASRGPSSPRSASPLPPSPRRPASRRRNWRPGGRVRRRVHRGRAPASTPWAHIVSAGSGQRGRRCRSAAGNSELPTVTASAIGNSAAVGWPLSRRHVSIRATAVTTLAQELLSATIEMSRQHLNQS